MLKLSSLILVSLLAAACGGTSKPASPEPSPSCQATGEHGTPATAEECECAGHLVVGDIGDGQVKCPDGVVEVSRIQYGIEGGVCCAKGEPPPAAE